MLLGIFKDVVVLDDILDLGQNLAWEVRIEFVQLIVVGENLVIRQRDRDDGEQFDSHSLDFLQRQLVCFRLRSKEVILSQVENTLSRSVLFCNRQYVALTIRHV